MEIALKDGIYFATMLVSVVWSYAKTNQKIELNKRELESMRETINFIIEKEKDMLRKEFSTIDEKIEVYLKKIELIEKKIDSLDRDSITFARKDEILKTYPTKDELNEKLSYIEQTSLMIKKEINEKLMRLEKENKELKDEINKRFEGIEKSLKEHIDEEREYSIRNQQVLNSILNAVNKIKE